MSIEPQSLPKTRHFRNWLSYAGGVLAISAFFAFLLLFSIDVFAHNGNPYMGILAYVVAPAFGFMGLVLIVLGVWIQRRHEKKNISLVPSGLHVDFTRPADRRKLLIFVVLSVVFLLCTAIGSYQSYNVSESVTFCGQTCHGPMKPEFTAYQNGSHAHVDCVACHVGHGAQAFVKAKMNGVHQLIGVMTGHYSHPIGTPIRNLRPARETCEECHWPQKFYGNLDRTYNHFLSDETNTPFSVRLSLKVGGADTSSGGPAGGIHWHVSKDNKVEYIATDERRQVIPWVRVTNPQGVVTEYRSPKFTNDISKYEIRTMDCIDCHNRPAHRYRSPNDAVDLAMSLGQIDRNLPWAKSNVVAVLIQPYDTEDHALTNIATTLQAKYPGAAGDAIVKAAQTIYSQNFFPEMKADWRAYPENIGHKNWPGCFRCHDDLHTAVGDPKKKIPANDCSACHTILAQGAGADLEKVNLKGNAFVHIDAEYSNFDCNSCHTGAFPKE